MKLIIKYLDRLKANIETIERLRQQHKRLVDIVAKEGGFTDIRIKQMRQTNSRVYEIMVDDNFLNAL